MSGTPKYTTVSLSERRAAEARAAVAAAQRQLESEAAKRRAAAQRERLERLRERNAEMSKRNGEQIARIRAEARRPGVVSAAPQQRIAPQERRGVHQRTATASAGSQQAPPAADAPPAFTPLTQAPPAFDPVVRSQALEPEAAQPEAIEPVPELSADTAARMIELHAAAQSLVAALAEHSRLTSVRDDLAAVDRTLAAVLEAEDQVAAPSAIAGLEGSLTAARTAYDELTELRARRRIIAAGLAAALPERYAVDPHLVEYADGAIRFSATALGEELRVAVMDDGRGNDVIGYQTDGAEIVESVEDGSVVTDCPDLAAALEAAHERLRDAGIDAGPLRWETEPERRRAGATASAARGRVRQR